MADGLGWTGPVVLGTALLGLGALSILKGANLNIVPESLYLYYTDYRFGFVRRGLIGQVFAPLLDRLPRHLHEPLILAWHLATLVLLLVLLTAWAARIAARAGRDMRLMALLLFVSPFLGSLAFFTGGPDVLICLLTLAAVVALRRGRPIIAWLAFLAGMLAHQLMIFTALPLMLFTSLAAPRYRRVSFAGSLALGLVACLVVVLAPPADERLIDRFITIGIPPDTARLIHDLQLDQDVAGMSRRMVGLWANFPMQGMIAVAYGGAAGIVILAYGLVTFRAALPALIPASPRLPGIAGRVLAGLLALGAGLAPLLALALAWDVSRLASLCPFTAFLAVAVLAGQSPAQPPPAGPWPAASACGVLLVLFLCMPFLGLWFEGVKLNQVRPLIPPASLSVAPWNWVVQGVEAVYRSPAAPSAFRAPP